jgi:spore germination cell wall hydrolase CwlJ-like protein
MSRLHAFSVVGPLSLALTLATVTMARSEPIQLAALTPGQTTTSVQTHHTLSELDCLAMNVYWEARSESRVGQEAVAAVTLNRWPIPHFRKPSARS